MWTRCDASLRRRDTSTSVFTGLLLLQGRLSLVRDEQMPLGWEGEPIETPKLDLGAESRHISGVGLLVPKTTSRIQGSKAEGRLMRYQSTIVDPFLDRTESAWEVLTAASLAFLSTRKVELVASNPWAQPAGIYKTSQRSAGRTFVGRSR